MHLRHLVIAALALCAGSPVFSTPAAEPKKIREPAVAGLFYPRDREALAHTVDRLLGAAKSERSPGRLVALICPHAGYSYSGPIAAAGFHLLQGLDYQTVILLAPSHYARLRAGSVSDADAFRTPLGDVPVSAKARQLAHAAPFALEPVCPVERPEWVANSSRTPPAAGQDTADTWEHADEVEVPFLQRTLGHFELLPVVMGDLDPAKAAVALAPLVDDHTLIVASSDLSHYHGYLEAQRLDRSCVDAICALDVAKMSDEEACGRIPILTLLHLARQRGWKPVLVDMRNSGDTSGDQARVVGYAAIAFYAMQLAPPSAPPETQGLTPGERRHLLRFARETLREVTATGRLPEVPATDITPALLERRACFVTLTERSALRGCIGNLTPEMPLYRAVLENTRSAALHDPRFPAVTEREVGQLEIEISVLTEPQPLAYSSPEDLLANLRPHRDGVVLRMGSAVATYLPQVWDDLPDKAAFLDSLARKAGRRAGDWRRPDTSVLIYHVESFKESDL